MRRARRRRAGSRGRLNPAPPDCAREGLRPPAPNAVSVRNRSLHQNLLAFAEQAALQLSSDALEGAEVPFELIETPGEGTPLYCYRPRSDEFIRDRLGVLGRLPTYRPAAQALESLGGLDAYLRARAEPRVPSTTGERTDAALRAFLSALYAETSEFEFSSERFDRAYAELEGAVYETRALTSVMVAVHGLELVSAEVQLGDGLALMRGETVPDAPREAVWSGPAAEGPSTLAVLTTEGVPGDPAPFDVARDRFRRLLTALRLVDAGSFALAPVAWARHDAGGWTLVPLPGGGDARPRPDPYLVDPDEEDALRGFCNLIARRSPGGGEGAVARGEVAWALARFEMGCERTDPFEAVTDHLAALRALLEPEGPGSGRLAQRLGAICAAPEDRAALAERTAHAISLERALVAGLAPADPHADRLVSELAHHLRSLLRDVLCGHLATDVVAVADELLSDAPTGEHTAVGATA